MIFVRPSVRPSFHSIFAETSFKKSGKLCLIPATQKNGSPSYREKRSIYGALKSDAILEAPLIPLPLYYIIFLYSTRRFSFSS